MYNFTFVQYTMQCNQKFLVRAINKFGKRLEIKCLQNWVYQRILLTHFLKLEICSSVGLRSVGKRLLKLVRRFLCYKNRSEILLRNPQGIRIERL